MPNPFSLEIDIEELGKGIEIPDEVEASDPGFLDELTSYDDVMHELIATREELNRARACCCGAAKVIQNVLLRNSSVGEREISYTSDSWHILARVSVKLYRGNDDFESAIS
jgi:hypothetical protein